MPAAWATPTPNHTKMMRAVLLRPCACAAGRAGSTKIDRPTQRAPGIPPDQLQDCRGRRRDHTGTPSEEGEGALSGLSGSKSTAAQESQLSRQRRAIEKAPATPVKGPGSAAVPIILRMHVQSHPQRSPWRHPHGANRGCAFVQLPAARARQGRGIRPIPASGSGKDWGRRQK